MAAAKQIHSQEIDPNSGTILVFLTGKEEINDFIKRFERALDDDKNRTMDSFKK